MSHTNAGRARRGARPNHEGNYAQKKAPEVNQSSMPLIPIQMPHYGTAPLNPYYHESPPNNHYMLPYNVYQHQLPPSGVSFHRFDMSVQARDGYVHNVAGHRDPRQLHTPPSKRVRTDARSLPTNTRTSDTNRRTSSQSQSQSQRSTPSKSALPRKTFSDFRITQITIGKWSSEEVKNDTEARDSRIRFCFRNGGDKDPDSTLSATEAALVAPDRLSISVERGSKRIIIPAHHIKGIKFSRQAGEIEIETDGWAAFECASQESYTQGSEDYLAKNTRVPQVCWQLTDEDITGGELAKVRLIHVKLDQDRPLTEPKWTRGSLADHIDVNSRFLKILRITDAETTHTLEKILDRWAENDMERAFFYEYHLTSDRLLTMLTGLMSKSNILTPTLIFLLEGLLALIKSSDVPEPRLVKLLREALLIIPEPMLRTSLDCVYAEFCSSDAQISTSPIHLHNSDAHLGGSKRQRGESEVPSEQLARTTLDEKRRRLSESDPQLPLLLLREESALTSRVAARSRSRTRAESEGAYIAPQMGTSKSNDSAMGLPAAASKLTISTDKQDTYEDGARMSREEMLRALEDCEDHAVSSESENQDQDAPISAASITVKTQALDDEEWPSLSH